MNKKTIILFILTLLSSVYSVDEIYSQTIKMGAPVSELGILGKGYGDSIVVRWVFDKENLFKIGAQTGYKLERRNADDPSSKFEVIAEKILPWNDTAWVKHSEKLMSKQNPSAKDSMFDLSLYAFFAIAFDMDKESGISSAENRAQLYAFLMLSGTRSTDIASAIGNRYVDRNVKANTTYEYKISLIGKTIYEVKSNIAKINSKPFKQGSLKHEVISGEKRIHINFSNREGINGVIYYKATSRRGPWEQLNKVPRTMFYGTDVDDSLMRFSDTVNIENYKKYYYKVIGLDGFGDTINLFTAKGMAKDMTPPKRVIMEIPEHNLKGGYVALKWKNIKPVEGDLYGYDIYRATDTKGPWKKINRRTVRKKYSTYKDYKFANQERNFYYVEAKDTAGNRKKCEPVYAFVTDLDPPKTPKWISGDMDTTGIVKLVITNNKENDFMGYRLFAANAEDHEFSPIGEWFKDTNATIIDTVMFDTTTLKTLTPYIYYRVKAYDFRWNESPFTPIMKVARIDTIPPTTPSFVDVRTDDKSITLGFNPSLSKDVKTQYLYRKTKDDKEWTKVIELDKTISVYKDTNVVENIKYFYSLRSEDMSGNLSKLSFPVHSMTYRLNMQELIGALNLNYDEEKKEINVFWNCNTQGIAESDYWYVLYKVKNDKLREYKNTRNTPSYLETNPKKGTHSYAVKVFFKDGTESKLSENKSIDIE